MSSGKGCLQCPLGQPVRVTGCCLHTERITLNYFPACHTYAIQGLVSLTSCLRLWRRMQLVRVRVKSLSRVQLFATPWTVAYQPSPSMGFSRQEYWSGLPFPSPGDLPNPGIKPGSNIGGRHFNL